MVITMPRREFAGRGARRLQDEAGVGVLQSDNGEALADWLRGEPVDIPFR